MKIYIDSVEEDKIAEYSDIISGITTTPTFFAKHKINPFDFYKKIANLHPNLDLQVELMGDTKEELQENLNKLLSLGIPKLTFKTPITKTSLEFISSNSYDFNVHLVYTIPQAIFAAAAGAKFICPLLGRMDDNGYDGVKTYRKIKKALALNGFDHVLVMASSIRTVNHVTRLFSTTKVDAVTLPPDIFHKCLNNLLTDSGIEIFKRDL